VNFTAYNFEELGKVSPGFMAKPKAATKPGPKRRRPGFTRAFYITDEKDSEFVEMLAKEEDRSVSSVMRRLLRQARLAFESSQNNN
jgi:hypothetical protein